jgi:hypothetical protein
MLPILPLPGRIDAAEEASEVPRNGNKHYPYKFQQQTVARQRLLWFSESLVV